MLSVRRELLKTSRVVEEMIAGLSEPSFRIAMQTFGVCVAEEWDEPGDVMRDAEGRAYVSMGVACDRRVESGCAALAIALRVFPDYVEQAGNLYRDTDFVDFRWAGESFRKGGWQGLESLLCYMQVGWPVRQKLRVAPGLEGKCDLCKRLETGYRKEELEPYRELAIALKKEGQ